MLTNLSAELRLEKCYEKYCELKTDLFSNDKSFEPEIAIVLGSGLGSHAMDIDVVATLDYSSLDGFPVSTVKGHVGRFVFGYIDGVSVVMMQGRVHYYEGYCMSDVVLPIRLMRKMGADKLVLTNAAGGVNKDFKAGDFMLITDQIASFVPNPLIGPNIESLGVRFPDMTNLYDKDFNSIIKNTAKELNIPLQEGVYIQFTGPAYESVTEVMMARTLGADAVGMSTACEAIAARHCGMKLCGISFISNPAAGVSPNPLAHNEVIEASAKAALSFKKLIFSIIPAISNR